MLRCKQNATASAGLTRKAAYVRNRPLFAGCGRVLVYTRVMSADNSILLAYALAGLLIGGLCLVTLLRARRVKQSLAAQERHGRS